MLTEQPLHSGLQWRWDTQFCVASPIPSPFSLSFCRRAGRGRKVPHGLLLCRAHCHGQGEPKPCKVRAGRSQDTICEWQPILLACIPESVVGEMAEMMERVPFFFSPLEIP